MTIQIGDKLPDATLTESTEFGEACPVSPKKVSVAEAVSGKKLKELRRQRHRLILDRDGAKCAFQNSRVAEKGEKMSSPSSLSAAVMR